MSGSNKPLIYFDSCIWIGMIKGEQRKDPTETAALAGLPYILDKKEIIVVSSTLIKVEVLEADLTEQQANIFKQVLKRKSVVQIVDATSPIMDKASEIRNYYKTIRNSDSSAARQPSTPDAIHLATAIHSTVMLFLHLMVKTKRMVVDY